MNKLLKIFFLIIVISLFSLKSNAQSYQDFFTEEADTISTKYSISLENTNFFRNNEYFNNFIEGYTLIGYFVKPKITYRYSERLKLTAGVYSQLYFGLEKKVYTIPLLRIDFQVTKNLQIIFGELQGTVNHDLHESVLDEERYLTENVENGLQIMYKTPKLKSEIWIDWEQFILQGSTYPEILTGGLSVKYFINDKNSQNSFHVNFTGIANHTGGQINNSNHRMHTITNTISGIHYTCQLENKYVDKVNLSVNYLTSMESPPSSSITYLYGYGILSEIELANKNLDFKLQHWFSEYYFSGRGSYLYQSYSSFREGFAEDQRALIIAKIFWHKIFYKSFKLGLGSDTYFDLYNRTTDYSMGFYMKVNLNYNFDKIKLK